MLIRRFRESSEATLIFRRSTANTFKIGIRGQIFSGLVGNIHQVSQSDVCFGDCCYEPSVF